MTEGMMLKGKTKDAVSTHPNHFFCQNKQQICTKGRTQISIILALDYGMYKNSGVFMRGFCYSTALLCWHW